MDKEGFFMKSSLIASITFASLTLISGLILSSTNTKAVTINGSTASVNASVTVGEACTISGTGMNTHTATISNKTYQAGIGETTIKVSCNDANGFSIYAIGYTGEEYSGTNHTKLVGTRTNETIATGTATSAGNPDVSNWAMKLSAVSGTYTPSIITEFSSYHAIPDTYTKVATRTSGTDVGNNPTGSSIKTTYAAYISATQPADTYNGKVKYTIFHPNTETPPQPQTTTAGKICYYPNSGNVVGTMGCQTVSASDTNATLLASNFSRAGYGFAGWSTTYDYSDSTGFYGPQEYIEFPAGTYTGSNPGLSLYAHWVKSAGSLQGWTGCSSLANSAITALTDQRDGETYAVAKLADGNCWIIENLRLESTANHNSDGALAQGYGVSSTYGSFSGLATAENTGFASTYTANSLYYSGTQEGTASINIGTTNYPAYRMPRYNNYNHQSSSANRPQNPASNSDINSATNAGMYSYGNYYTWSAAIADTTYYSTNNQSTTNTSLCPSGWRLPKGGDKTRITSNNDNEFWNLIVIGLNNTVPANYESKTQPYYTGSGEAGPVANKLRAYPNNFLYSGAFNGSSAMLGGTFGYYWSSTAYGGTGSYLLLLSYGYLVPGSENNSINFGQSIRCIAGS